MMHIEKTCRDFLDEAGDDMTWKWDGRFQAVLSEFNVDEQEQKIDLLNKILDNSWHIENIDQAPQVVHMITQYLGGIRAGQMLFTTDTSRDAFLYCAWWPWGNGNTISLRLAPIYKKLTASERNEKIQHFRGWFGL